MVGQELDQSEAQIAKDSIYRTILIICSMPDRHQSLGDLPVQKGQRFYYREELDSSRR